ncbi:hypothetical protein TNCV_1877851 [Trichonephila clavipes]|nr:hypothetical protein TNCV_1877851 [Trichonephila clavipes]
MVEDLFLRMMETSVLSKAFTDYRSAFTSLRMLQSKCSSGVPPRSTSTLKTIHISCNTRGVASVISVIRTPVCNTFSIYFEQ